MGDRLEKLFRILGSSNEHEAAAALKMIVQLKTKNGQTWNQFIDGLKAVNFGEKAHANGHQRPKQAYGGNPRSDGSEHYQDVFRYANARYDYGFGGFDSWSDAGRARAQEEDKRRRQAQEADALRNAFTQRQADMEAAKKFANAVQSDPVAEKIYKSTRPKEPSKKWFGGFDFSGK